MIVLILPDISAEDDLLARAHRGDTEALQQIYTDYYTPVYQFIRMRTDDRYTAEDLAAEVFLKLVRAFRERKGPRDSLRGWLFKVARHQIYDHYGRGKKFTETVLEEWLPMSDEDAPEAQFIRTMNIETARQAILHLTDDQQEVLILRFGQMLSLQETADIMGKQANTIKQLQLRALRALERVLSQPALEVNEQ